MKNISTLYKDISVTSKGEIIQGSNKLNIYEVIPVNVLEKNDTVRSKIYNLYYACVKGMPDEFKVLVVKEKANYTKSIERLQKRATKVASETLRAAIITYAENLEKVFSENTTTFNRYYIITKSTAEVQERFAALEEIGVNLKRIASEYEIQEVLKKGCYK